VVIDVIDIMRVAFRQSENHPPISADCYRPKAFEVTFERMQAEAWQIHIRNRTGGIQPCQNVTKLYCVFADHAARVVVLVKAFQSFMTDRADHISS